MSGKSLILLGLIGLSGYALTKNVPPIPPGTSAADSAAFNQAGIGARLHYGIGLLGSRLVRSAVTGMVNSTEQTLRDMKPAIKSAKGADAVRAKQFARKIEVMDSLALADLQYGKPVKSVRGAMEAKNLLNAVRQQINRRF